MGSTSFVSFLGPLLVAWVTAVGADSPCGCVATQSQRFGLAVDKLSNKSPYKRQSNTFSLSLNNGVLIDAQGRTGYIASNEQFQFDGPPQAGAKFVSGFSLCANGTLALGSSAVWYQCSSGSFYNLYDASIDPVACSQVLIRAVNVDSGALLLPSSANAASCSATAGGPQVTAVQPVSQIADGQPQASIGVKPISQISDGQIQAPTATAPASANPTTNPAAVIPPAVSSPAVIAPAVISPAVAPTVSGIPVPATTAAGPVAAPPGIQASVPAPGYIPSSQIPASPAVVGGGGSAAPVAATGVAAQPTAPAPSTVIPPPVSSTSSLRFSTVSASAVSSSVSSASPTAPSSSPSATKASGAGSFAEGNRGSHALFAATISIFAWAWGI